MQSHLILTSNYATIKRGYVETKLYKEIEKVVEKISQNIFYGQI